MKSRSDRWPFRDLILFAAMIFALPLIAGLVMP
jgi:hypothetical protein